MDMLINPFTVTILFALGWSALVNFRPKIGRIVCGVFFLLMGLGVNLTVLLTDPYLYAQAGANAYLPMYRWFFSEVLGSVPVPFVIALIAFETCVGLLILSRGKGVTLGVIGVVLFCLLLVPVGVEELAAPFVAIPFVLLLRRDWPAPALPFLKLAWM